MNSIIGLCHCESAVSPTVERLKEAGIVEERIQILTNPNTINKTLGCDPVCVIKNYAIYGLTIGIGVYAIFGVAAALCQCNLLGYGLGYGIGTFLGVVLAGAFVGGFIGVVAGAAEAEKNTHLYTQGVRLGGQVISVRAMDEEIEPIKQILVKENASGVRVLQERGV